MKCDAGIHQEMCAYVVLSANTTVFQGFGERVPNELTASAPCTMRIHERSLAFSKDCFSDADSAF